jgi:NAD(P)-dependent dehydrogenase (short-subunit alcohol dehydrogenase family)
MNAAITVSHIERNPELLGQTVVVIGGSAGIGLETARRASAEGAKLILTGRSPERLQRERGPSSVSVMPAKIMQASSWPVESR